MTRLTHSLFAALLVIQSRTRAYALYIAPVQQQERRQVPEIDGSQGGFIGLVVALSILIVVCCLGVFFLLRNHEPTEQERAARRERYHHQRERYDSASTIPSSFNSFKEKFKHIWTNRKDSGDGTRRRGGRGWIQAGSGDEWESDSDRGGDPELATATIGSAPHGTLSEGGKAHRIPPLTSRHEIQDNARVVDSPLSDTGSSFIPVHYTDPFSKDSPTSHMSPVGMITERSQSPLSISSPQEEGSIMEEDDDDDVSRPPTHHHHLSTMSTTSVRTAVGSKFIEQL